MEPAPPQARKSTWLNVQPSIEADGLGAQVSHFFFCPDQAQTDGPGKKFGAIGQHDSVGRDNHNIVSFSVRRCDSG